MEAVPIQEACFFAGTFLGCRQGTGGVQGPRTACGAGGPGRISQACLGVRPAAFSLRSRSVPDLLLFSLGLWTSVKDLVHRVRACPLTVFGPALSETINSCLTKHLEQLKAPEGTLAEALRNLHLDSSPDASAVTPGSTPGETPVPGTCRWKCVCYGIGNFATCVTARHQLTFLLLFLEKCQVHFWILDPPLPWSSQGTRTGLWVDRTHSSLLQIPRRHCWVYDPLFSQLEIAVLNSLGVTVLSENEVSGLGKGSRRAV